jgi:hypothetical protein
MTGDQLLPLAAVFVGVAALNLAVTWFLVRRNRDPAELLGSAASRSSDTDGEGAEVGPTLVLDGDPGTDPARETGRPDGGDEPPPLDADDETVLCRHCGAENRAEYQYCRWCVRSGFVDEDAGVTAGTAMTDRSL